MEEKHIETTKVAIAIFAFVIFAYLVFTNIVFLKSIAQGYGLLGLFVASIIANASIFLPMPIDIILFAVAAQETSIIEVLFLGIVVGTGAAIGEMTAYILGLLGISAMQKAKNKEFKRLDEIREKLGKKGMVFVALGALTPFPFDLIGIAAGLIKYDPKKFFIAALIGKVLRYLIIGVAAFYGFAVIKDFFLL